MTIDFHSNFWINKPFVPRIAQQQTTVNKTFTKDSFEKTIENNLVTFQNTEL